MRVQKDNLFLSALTWGAFLIVASAPMKGFSNDNSIKPNVLWILIENIGPEFSCYGYPLVQTPNIDKLASEGIIYENAFTNNPVCSPSRTSLITGMYPNAIGGHHHRSFFDLPDSIRTIPEVFRDNGYFTSLGNGYTGKTDYNFRLVDRKLWDGNDWSEREDGQPFFAQLTLNQSHRGMHRHNPYDRRSWMHEYYRDMLTPFNPTDTAEKKPVEELYDIVNDPQELNNLVDDPAYMEELNKHRQVLKGWMLDIDDKARLRETLGDVRESSFIPYIVFPSEEEQYDHSNLKKIFTND